MQKQSTHNVHSDKKHSQMNSWRFQKVAWPCDVSGDYWPRLESATQDIQSAMKQVFHDAEEEDAENALTVVTSKKKPEKTVREKLLAAVNKREVAYAEFRAADAALTNMIDTADLTAEDVEDVLARVGSHMERLTRVAASLQKRKQTLQQASQPVSCSTSSNSIEVTSCSVGSSAGSWSTLSLTSCSSTICGSCPVSQ